MRAIRIGLPRLLTVALWASLLCYQFYKLTHAQIWRDDAFFANVARSFVSGEGYSAVFFNQYMPFSFGTTSGPIVILPAALLMALFGNQYWVPGLASILLINSLLVALFFQLRALLGGRSWWCAAIGLSLFLAWTTMDYWVEGEYLFVWHVLMGEIPACLLSATGLCIASRHFSQRKSLIAGGLCMGAALLCKIMLVFTVLAFAVAAFLRLNARTRITTLLPFACAAALPSLAFELVQFLCQGPAAYVAARLASWNFTLSIGWNVPSAHEFILRLMARLAELYTLLGGINTFLFCIVFIAILEATAMRKRASAENMVIAVCMGAVLLHLAWWLLLSNGLVRYLVQSVGFMAFGLAVLLACYVTSGEKYAGLALLLPVLLLVGRADSVYNLYTYAHEQNHVLADELAARDRLVALQQKGYRIFACGNNFELEYLMPLQRNFYPCEEALTYPSDRPALLATYYEFRHHSNETVVIYAHESSAIFREVPPAVAARCSYRAERIGRTAISYCNP